MLSRDSLNLSPPQQPSFSLFGFGYHCTEYCNHEKSKTVCAAGAHSEKSFGYVGAPRE